MHSEKIRIWESPVSDSVKKTGRTYLRSFLRSHSSAETMEKGVVVMSRGISSQGKPRSQ